MRRTLAALSSCLALLALGCPKGAAQTDAGPPSIAQAMPASAAPPARPPEIDALWVRAKEAASPDAGEDADTLADDLARLARREGVAGLIERGAHPTWRNVAAQAMGYTDGFSAMAWLGEVAAGPDDPDATSALESAVMLASQRRHQVDADDEEELHAGCDKLLALAKDVKAPRRRRVLAVRALRMLTDKGCAKPSDIPNDVDAK